MTNIERTEAFLKEQFANCAFLKNILPMGSTDCSIPTGWLMRPERLHAERDWTKKD